MRPDGIEVKKIARCIEYLSVMITSIWLSGTISAVAYMGVLIGAFSHKHLTTILLFISGIICFLFLFFKRSKYRLGYLRIIYGLAGLANLISVAAIQITAPWAQRIVFVSALLWFVVMLVGLGSFLRNRSYDPLNEDKSQRLL